MPTEQAIVEQFRTLIRRVMNPDVYNPTNQEVRDFFELVVPYLNPENFAENDVLVCREENGNKVLVPEQLQPTYWKLVNPINVRHVSASYDSSDNELVFLDIPTAVAASVPGDTIIVHPGEYTLSDMLVLDATKADVIEFEPGSKVIGEADAVEGNIKVTSGNCKIIGYGEFENTSTSPMFVFDVGYQLGNNQTLKCYRITASGVGQCIALKSCNLELECIDVRQTNASGYNAITIENSLATDTVTAKIHYASSYNAVINITAGHQDAKLYFRECAFRKLSSIVADAVIAIQDCSTRVYLISSSLQNLTDEFNANGISGDGTLSAIMLNGTIISTVNADSYSLYNIPDVQSISSAGKKELSSCTETAGTFLVDDDIPSNLYV